MRCAALVLWAACTIALSAAVIGDAATEWLANLAAGHIVDAHHESLLPAAVCAAALLVTLCAFAVFAGRACAEAYARLIAAPWLHVLFLIATAVLTLAVVVAMEGYETHFGGVNAFDARSVLAQHLLPSLGAYACVAGLIDRLVRACVRAAIAGWDALLRAAAPFARRFPSLSTPKPLDPRDEFSLQADAGRTHPSWSLRAPPRHGHLMSVAFFWRISWTNFERARSCARSFSSFSRICT
jgi:hypothetical protein